MPIHSRKFLYSLPFIDSAQLAEHLLEINLLARADGHASPLVEMQMDGTAERADVWEETLSDHSKQLVIQLC